MTFNEFAEMVARVFVYSGSTPPTLAQKEAWFEDVKQIPAKAIREIEREIKKRDTTSRTSNIPKIVKDIFAASQDAREGFGMAYDPIEDFRFPIHKMYHAMTILETRGNEAFLAYCNIERMPQNDRDRVRCKFNAIREGQRGSNLAPRSAISEKSPEETPF